MEFHHATQASDILNFLRQQQADELNCDVILQRCVTAVPANESVPAHRCVLAANSSYFRALFRCGLNDSNFSTLLIPAMSSASLRDVIQFMYTGDVTISWKNVEQTLNLVDYLGVAPLVKFCTEFLRQNLTDETCLKIKAFISTYNLNDIDDDVTNYVVLRWARLIQSDDITELPQEVLRNLLRADGPTSFAREVDVLDAVTRWARHHRNVEIATNLTDNENNFSEVILSTFQLLECVEFEYLPKAVLRSKVLQCPDVVFWLSSQKPEVLRKMEEALMAIPSSVRNVCDVVFVRSRISTVGEQLRILVYVIELDEWRVWNAHTSDAASLHGLESMIVSEGWLYLLCSTIEDMHGYLHKAREWKRFYRVSLDTGTWETLTSPPAVRRQCRLVSMIDSILVVDRSGVMDEFSVEEGRWNRTLCATGFPAVSSSCTLCILPMPVDRKLYVLRTVSSGHSFEYAEKCFVLYHCDLLEEIPKWSIISEVEANEIFTIASMGKVASTSSDDPNFYGYNISPGLITLTDELGHARAAFDLTTRAWSAKETKITRPSYMCTADVYGSTACGERVYYVARNGQKGCTNPGEDPDEYNTFWMFDNLRRRFKMTAQPPRCPSGLLCHVTLSRATLDSTTNMHASV